jgi:hypothetical protein
VPASLTACVRAEALSSFGFQYLSETYLPLKLQEVRLRPSSADAELLKLHAPSLRAQGDWI